jgi:hypothetical protein
VIRTLLPARQSSTLPSLVVGFFFLLCFAWISEERYRLRTSEVTAPSHPLRGSRAALATALEGRLGAELSEAQRLGGVRLWDAADGKGIFPKETVGAKASAGGSNAAGGRKAQPRERDRTVKKNRSGGGDDEIDPKLWESEADVEEEEGGEWGGGVGVGESARAGAGAGAKPKLAPALAPGTVRGGWTWTGSLWHVSDRRTAGVSEAAAAWFERRTVQARLTFDRFIDCARHAADLGAAGAGAAGGARGGGEVVVGLQGINLRPLVDHLDDIVVHRGNRARLGKGSEAPRQERVVNALRLPAGGGFLPARQWSSCALVGSSGRLLSEPASGAAIDSHDVVVRLNQAPTWGYARQVGSKTTHRVLNRLWTRAYRTSGGVVHGMALPLERGVSLLVTRATGQEFELLRDHLGEPSAWQRQDVEVLYLSSRTPSAAGGLLREHRARSCAAGAGPHTGLNVPSSGLVAVVLLAHLCHRVDVYGLGGGIADSGWVGGNDTAAGARAGAEAEPASRTRAGARAETVDSYHYYKGEMREKGVPAASCLTSILIRLFVRNISMYALELRLSQCGSVIYIAYKLRGPCTANEWMDAREQAALWSLLRGGGARAVGDDVHCFECEAALLRQLDREGHITFCGGGGDRVADVGGGGDDELCGCAAPNGRERECRTATAASGGEGGGEGEGEGSTKEAAFKMNDTDRGRMRRVFERAERDKRKERERNVGNRDLKGGASQARGGAGVTDAS